MTKLFAVVFGVCILLATSSIADARHTDGLEGLLIGGVGGAAIGHVITGTPEGVIFGSFLGGTIGMLIDADYDRNHVVVIKERHRPHRHWPGHYERRHWSHRDDRHYYGRHYKKHRHGDRYWDRSDRHRGRHLR